MSIDYRAYPILYVDDETPNLVAVRYALEDSFTLLTATSGDEALRILREEDVAVLVSDQRMPAMTGTELCEKAREIRPDTIRIIITAYADLHAAIEAINRGQVTRYLAKPFRNEDLIEILQTAIELVHIHRTVRDMEVRLLRAGQASTARTLNAELAHELNNFVTSLSMNVQQVADLVEVARRNLKQANADRALEAIETIRDCQSDAVEALDQLRNMIQRMRRGEAVAAIVSARSDAARVVDSTARILRTEIQRVGQLRIVLDGSPTVPMEASALGQVVMNLLLNAAQACDDGTGKHEVVASVGATSERATIRVTDTGPGIPEGTLSRIFDAYFTTKEGGTGLGLAIVRDLIERAGGTIKAENPPTGGAAFTVELPTVGYSTAPPPPA
jgi:signal transduction histidine kinase